MEIIYTKHALEKFKVLQIEGWYITREKIRQIIINPRWRGASRFGQATVMSLVDERHIIRIVFNQENDIITVVTFHIARRGKYESTL